MQAHAADHHRPCRSCYWMAKCRVLRQMSLYTMNSLFTQLCWRIQILSESSSVVVCVTCIVSLFSAESGSYTHLQKDASRAHTAFCTANLHLPNMNAGSGGEGATAREVLRHKSVEEVVMVDIDKVSPASGRCSMHLHGNLLQRERTLLPIMLPAASLLFMLFFAFSSR